MKLKIITRTNNMCLFNNILKIKIGFYPNGYLYFAEVIEELVDDNDKWLIPCLSFKESVKKYPDAL